MGLHSHPQAELGPMLPPIGELRVIANEVQQLAPILQHAIATGDHLRAARTLNRLRACVGAANERGLV